MNKVSTYQIIPYGCRLIEISCYFYDSQNLDFRITLNIRSRGEKSNDELFNSSQNVRRQKFPHEYSIIKK